MKDQRVPSKKDLFTGWKVPEMTIAFNLAFLRIAGIIHYSLKKNGNDIEKSFDDFINDAQKDTSKYEHIFVILRDYLWKGYKTDKNSSGSQVLNNEPNLIIEMLQRLKEIRNFHSHYYHDNAVLIFSPALCKHIEKLHDNAVNAQAEKKVATIDKYKSHRKKPKQKLFTTHNNKKYISKPGRVFFLSFFLVRSEMMKCLQQLKDFKHTETHVSELQLLVFMYYTHRDGAARQHYGQQENELRTLDSNQQKDILNARQFYKIVSYLNDIPAVCHDTALFPLLDQNQIIDNVNTLLTFCQQFESLRSLAMVQIPEKENRIAISIDGYQIHLSQKTLHRLLLDSIRLQDNGEKIINKLRAFVDERIHLRNLINENERNYVADDTLAQEYDQYMRFKLRSDFLSGLMKYWLDGIDYTTLKHYKEKNLGSFQHEIVRQPIELDYYDFYFEEDDKPRASDQFVRFAVQYLMDFQVVPSWCWLFERFEIERQMKKAKGSTQATEHFVNKRRTQFFSNAPSFEDNEDEEANSKWRLAIKDGQVVVGISSVENGKSISRKFLLGHRTLKNLLITHLIENKPIEELLGLLDKELNSFETEKDITKLAILTKNELPISKLVASKDEKMLDNEAIREKCIDKLDRLCGLEGLKKQKELCRTRSQKNRFVMDCYLYFDWNYPNQSEFKFLRKDEYQQMSVYHYSLEKREGNSHEFLIDPIKNHLPEEIKNLLETALSLDDLVEKVYEKTTELLLEWKQQFEDTRIKIKYLKEIVSKLAVKTYQTPATSTHIPFDVHPFLVIRHFYNIENPEDKFNLSAKVWKNVTLQRGLRATHYAFEHYLERFGTSGNDLQKQRRKIIGIQNELRCHDTLLWQIAQRYLNQTNTAYQEFIFAKMNRKQDEWNITNLRKTEIKVPFNEYILNIKFHQLDDYLLVESKKRILLALNQIKRRYSIAPNNMQVSIENDSYIVAYDEVFKEIQRVYNDSLHCTAELLAWEKNVVDTIAEPELQALGNNKLPNGKEHVNFNEVLQKTNFGDTDKKLLKDIRNTAFHAKIPDGWAYREQTQITLMKRLFGFQTPAERKTKK